MPFLLHKVSKPTRCLSIGSSDSSGGAGIQGDVKALASIGCYASTVVIGLTAQNTQGVVARHSVPAEFVVAQLEAVLADIPVQGVKIGMTWSPALIGAVAKAVTGLAVPIVLDPVLVAASGAALGGEDDVISAVIDDLFPLARVITPNLREAQILTGLPEVADPIELSERLVALGARSVIITGGSPAGRDWLLDGAAHRELDGDHYDTEADHGAGCAHSAILAGLLADGCELPEAAAAAARLVASGVRDGLTTIGAGRHPVDVLGLVGP